MSQSHGQQSSSLNTNSIPPAKKSRMQSPDTQNNTFLFTSESVGEGHPGKFEDMQVILLTTNPLAHVCMSDARLQHAKHPRYLLSLFNRLNWKYFVLFFR